MTAEIRQRRHVDAAGFAQLSHLVTMDAALNDGAVRVYALLLRYAQQKDKCWPGVARLAEDLDKSQPTIKRHLAVLVERGLVTRDRRRNTSSVTWLEDLETVYNSVVRNDTGIKNDTSNSGGIKNDPAVRIKNDPTVRIKNDPKRITRRRTTSENKNKTAAGSQSGVMCTIHNAEMEQRQKAGKTWYSHRLEDGQWCKGTNGEGKRHEPTRTDTPCGIVLAAGYGCAGKGWDVCQGCEWG